MNIWIDGDACPKPIKQILFRAAVKRTIPLWIVANHFVNIPPSPLIKRILVESGLDSADQYILNHMQKQDLVITSDILLAELVLKQEGLALNPRGLLYSDNNINAIVSMRNMNETLRSSGLIQGGPAQLNEKDILQFSNHLDRLITRAKR